MDIPPNHGEAQGDQASNRITKVPRAEFQPRSSGPCSGTRRGTRCHDVQMVEIFLMPRNMDLTGCCLFF